MIVNEGRAARAVLPLHRDTPERFGILAKGKRTDNGIVPNEMVLTAAEMQLDMAA